MSLRVLIVGDWAYEVYEDSLAYGLSQCGATVDKFSVGKVYDTYVGKFEKKYSFGGIVTQSLFKKLCKKLKFQKYDIIIFWRVTIFNSSQFLSLRNLTNAIFVGYNHDDFSAPFIEKAYGWGQRLFWSKYVQTLDQLDIHFFKRQSNIEFAKNAGCNWSFEFPMWYDPRLHYFEDDIADSFVHDISFIGHFENDGRDKYIRALINAGLEVTIYGGKTWDDSCSPRLLHAVQRFPAVHGSEYRKSIQKSCISLCFLSGLNNDVYTRRCMEIPACGGLLISERTEYLQELYSDGTEALLFSSTDELIEKVQLVLGNPKLRSSIARAGAARVTKDQHDIISRGRMVLDVCKQFKEREKIC